MRWTPLLFGLVLATPSVAQVSTETGWHLVLEEGVKGKVVQGSLEELTRAVRSGLPIRVRWLADEPYPGTRTEYAGQPELILVRGSGTTTPQITARFSGILDNLQGTLEFISTGSVWGYFSSGSERRPDLLATWWYAEGLADTLRTHAKTRLPSPLRPTSRPPSVRP